MKDAVFWSVPETGDILCRLCPHSCGIAEEETGFCGVRRNLGGKLIAESYGKVTSIALDPIEKKPLYHFHPGSKILSLGSYGCNFRCGFCQNHRISMETAPADFYSPEKVAEISMELEPKGNIGVAYTYNEPLIGYEFVRDCAKLIAGQGQKNVLVTNGFIRPRPLEALLAHIHAMNIDLKSFSPGFYREIGGRLSDVLDIIALAAGQCHIEVTTLIIPGKNDSPEEINSIARWISEINKDIPLHISRFSPAYKLRDIPPAPAEAIFRLAEVARKHLSYVYPSRTFT